MDTFPRKTISYKILVIGDSYTGKTSIVKRYVQNTFATNCTSSIGVDFATKRLKWDNETDINLQLWDIAGQERFGSMTRTYYQNAKAAFIVFDFTKNSTFDVIKKWKDDLDTKLRFGNTEDPIPVILLANKIDLVTKDDDYKIFCDKINRGCQENGFISWVETSASKNIGIDKAVFELITAILERDKNTTINDMDIMYDTPITLKRGSKSSDDYGCCS